MAFVSSPSSINEVNTAKVQVSTATSSVIIDSTLDSTANLSDTTIYAFLANQLNGSQLVHEDLEKIHEDDLEEIDLKWQLALLSMRARRYYQRIRKKITINGSDTAAYDKPRNHDNGNRNQDSLSRTVNVEETSSKAMVAIDEAGFDWSFMAEEEVTTNMALMAFSDSEGAKYLITVEKVWGIPPPPTSLFAPLTIDFSNYSLEEFQHPEFKGYGPKASKSVYVDTSNEVNKTPDTPLVEGLVLEKEKQTVFPTKIEFVKQQDKITRKPVKVNYNYTTNMTHPNAQRNMVLRAVLMKTGLKPFNTAKTVNTTLPKSIVFSAKQMSRFSKSAQSTIKRPYQSKIVLTNKNFSQKVNTAKAQAVNTARPKVVNTARPKAVNTAKPNSVVVNTVRANKENAIKASTCWVWRPTKLDSASITLKKHNYIDARGISKSAMWIVDALGTRHATFPISQISWSLMKDMLPLVEESEEERSLVKLPDESQILLKIPRKNNMYSVDMKNIVPKESLTCLVAKATLDESMLWHRRLGHVNFKTINKLVKDNLVRGLPLKRFENDQTCVACLKGKQHKASSSKDETSGILKIFITEIENLADKKVKIIRCDNGTEFKNRVMNEFCEKKGIKREYSVARTPQQNGVAERRNRTLIEAARTMLADSKLPTTFWAEAVNTACYVQNRVIIVKPHNKTPYELFRGRTPALSFMRPFGCHVSILNTLDHLGKFDGKSDDGFFVGYSLTSKAFRVYNIRTRIIEENLHIRFLEDKPIILGDGPKWLFDLDSLTKSMNYMSVIAGTNSNDFAGSEVSIGEGSTSKETDTSQDYIMMPLWKDSSLIDSPSMNVSHDEPELSCDAEKKDNEGVSKESRVDDQEKPESSTLNINTAGPSINTASANLKTGSLHINTVSPTVITTRLNHSQTVSDIFSLRDKVTSEATHADLFGDETKIDMSNLNALYQIRGMTKTANEQGFLSAVYEGKTYEDLHTCMFFCFLSQEEPKRVTKALSDLAWVEAMQEELLQFKLQKVWVLVDLPKGKRAIEEGIDYEEVFALVARIKAIRLFLPYASFMGFMMYQMDVKSAFLYGQIEEELYVCQPLGFEDHDYPNMVYKVVKALYGELTFFLGLQVNQKEDGIFISQDKYVTNILKKFGFQDVRTSSIPVDTEKPLLKDSDGDDVYLYRDSPFNLVAYSDSDYARASLNRKSITGGCQFLRCRLISWQCKKQVVVATSSTKAEYVAAASCCIQDKQIEYLMLNASPLKYCLRGGYLNVSHDEPELSCDAEKKDDEGVSKGSGVDDQEKLESSTPNINTVGPSINTATANLKTGSLHINSVSPTIITTRSNRSQTVLDIFSFSN
ncbi:putative ribonuclease H-like domain-containing protein [Tanacetum coccineum]|uniref:Ribonuclease H-like domain-containing protein n=1 Tax=Tanacetum coccineum TaxID=301880 RepID=A0ABQ4WP05_9ASTR